VYVSDWQDDPWRRPEFVVRTTGDARALVPALRRMLREVSPRSPLLFPRTLREVMHMFIAPQELAMTLFTVFATIALALAALGVYAVMAYIVTARTREFGIRSALGAGRGSVMLLVLRQGMIAASVGSAVGLIMAVAGARVIEGLIAGVPTHDWITFVAAPILLLAVTLAACMIPARVAVNVQPVEALRAE
jgi:ABC-type antimicrobial peptide transport system permease subunit